MTAPQFYEFGPYRLDVATGRLLRKGEPVALTPKAAFVSYRDAPKVQQRIE